MKTMMKLLALVMSMLMVMSMVACTNDANTTDPSEDVTTAPSSSTEGTKPSDEKPSDDKPVDDGKVEYKIYVVDADNNPVADVMVQICIDNSCNPRKTDENGVAVYRLPKGTGYTAGFTKFYEESKVYLEESTEITLIYNPPVEE